MFHSDFTILQYKFDIPKFDKHKNTIKQKYATANTTQHFLITTYCMYIQYVLAFHKQLYWSYLSAETYPQPPYTVYAQLNTSKDKKSKPEFQNLYA